ncbi:hypothetical protein E4K72_18970, partial [Oxalobacteraceae bacterium OM1]
MKASLGRRMAATVFLSLPLTVFADGVSVRFDLSSPSASPFPSDRFTLTDGSQLTGRRVNLPKPDCGQRPSDCADIDVLNTLDGFSTQPRITIPFTGDIDVSSVNSDTVFLMNLGDTDGFAGAGQKVGINQVLWDPATKTLVVQPDALLNEHSRYVLVVTDGVRDAAGKALKSGGFGEIFGVGQDRDTAEYRRDLRDAMRAPLPGNGRVVAATLFSTQTISADLYKIMKTVKQSRPEPASFMVGSANGAAVRAVFPLNTL